MILLIIAEVFGGLVSTKESFAVSGSAIPWDGECPPAVSRKAKTGLPAVAVMYLHTTSL